MIEPSEDTKTFTRREAREALKYFDAGNFELAADRIRHAMIWAYVPDRNINYWLGTCRDLRDGIPLPDVARAKLVAAILTGVSQ